MADWPWNVLHLPANASEAEVQSAWQRWRAGARPSDPGYAEMERAFAAAFEQTAGRPAMPASTVSPLDPPNASSAAPSSQDQYEVAHELLDRAESARDFEDFVARVRQLPLWTSTQTAELTDRQMRDLLLQRPARPVAIIRLSRFFNWQPDSPPLQAPESDRQWRALMRSAWAEFAPPDPGYTSDLGRIFLLIGGILAVLVLLLILPRLLAGSIGLLIPLAFAAVCACALIYFKR